MIGILDADIGNLRSLSNAVYSLGYDFVLLDHPSKFAGISHLIIPGVGSFAQAMKHIENRDLLRPTREFARGGGPTLGICLGMQLLAERGNEGGDTAGFGFVRGRVSRMAPSGRERLPHVGWNTVRFKRTHPVFEKVRDGIDFYFVHSYSMEVADRSSVLGETDYGGPFTSIAGAGSIIGFQFHPEKSQHNGLKLLENFCEWNGRC